MTLTVDMLASAAYEAAKTNTTFTLPPEISDVDVSTAIAYLQIAASKIRAVAWHGEISKPYLIHTNAYGEAIDADGRTWGD